jgi:hypothetical protein
MDETLPVDVAPAQRTKFALAQAGAERATPGLHSRSMN